MHILRNAASFSRVQSYLQRFKSLEEEVNRREKQFIDKKQQLRRFRELTQLTNQDKIQKYLNVFLDRPYESWTVQKQKERLKSMHDLLNELKKEEESRTKISKRLAEEQKMNRQKIFLSDLARFANKFHIIAYKEKFNQQIKVGLELSCKNLENKLQRQGVEFLGSQGEKHNKQLHETVDGEGQIVDQVLQRGIRARGALIGKAKIRAKKH